MKRFLLLSMAFLSALVISPSLAADPPPFGVIPAPETEVCTPDAVDLGCKIQTGRVELRDIPRVIIHLIDLFSKLAGTISVIVIILAGWLFIVSGISEDKQKAINTLKYGLIGLAVTMLAWVIVNLIQTQLTS